MQITLIIVAISLLSTLVSGLAWKAEHAHVIALEQQIDLSNQEAALVLSNATSRAAKAEADAAISANQLESIAIKATQSTDNFKRDHSTVRLRDPGQRQNCPDPVPKSASARESETDPAPGELSKELSGFLSDQAWRADTVANYADECHRFVANNCGIAP